MTRRGGAWQYPAAEQGGAGPLQDQAARSRFDVGGRAAPRAPAAPRARAAEPEGPAPPGRGDGEPDATDDMKLPQVFMPGHTTGDPVLDATLKRQGVIMTGDDRPFGMPPVPNPTAPRAGAAGARANAALDGEMSDDDGKDEPAAGADAGRGGKMAPRADAGRAEPGAEGAGAGVGQPGDAGGRKEEAEEEEEESEKMEFEGRRVSARVYREIQEFREQLMRGAQDPEFLAQKQKVQSVTLASRCFCMFPQFTPALIVRSGRIWES